MFVYIYYSQQRIDPINFFFFHNLFSLISFARGDEDNSKIRFFFLKERIFDAGVPHRYNKQKFDRTINFIIFKSTKIFFYFKGMNLRGARD